MVFYLIPFATYLFDFAQGPVLGPVLVFVLGLALELVLVELVGGRSVWVWAIASRADSKMVGTSFALLSFLLKWLHRCLH
jgi:hypothetical protein